VLVVGLLATCGRRDVSLPASPTASAELRQVRGVLDDPRIHEASGLVASRRNRGVLWVHNDSGDTTRIFAIDTRARLVGTYYLPLTRARDWEDIALGPGPDPGRDYLYIGDIGDNQRRRRQIVVHRVPEPKVVRASMPIDTSLSAAETLVLLYPDGPHDSETLLVDPLTGDLFVVAKESGRQGVYRAPYPLRDGSTVALERVSELRLAIPGAASQRAVAGDIAPSGQWVLVKSYDFVFRWPRRAADAWFSVEPQLLPYVPEPQGEAIAWAADEMGYFTLSEVAGGAPAILYYYPLPPPERSLRHARLGG
jgi:hypothetical protein